MYDSGLSRLYHQGKRDVRGQMLSSQGQSGIHNTHIYTRTHTCTHPRAWKQICIHVYIQGRGNIRTYVHIQGSGKIRTDVHIKGRGNRYVHNYTLKGVETDMHTCTHPRAWKQIRTYVHNQRLGKNTHTCTQSRAWKQIRTHIHNQGLGENTHTCTHPRA